MRIHIRKAVSCLLSAAILCLPAQIPANAIGTRQVLVTDTAELLSALADAQAGDEIILREGIYQNDAWVGIWAAFYSEGQGTAQQHIVLRSEDPAHPATICGVSQENKVALYIAGDYWELRDLKVCEGAKGIFLRNSNYSVISGCEVYNTGDEGIHIIDNSSYCLVENSYVHDTGTVRPGYGEAIYIGSAKGNTEYGFDCHYNTVRGCRLGPNTAAEHVDIKEYTIGTVVEDCIFDGTGISGENYANSFISNKGNYGTVRRNTGYRNGNAQILYGFELSVQLDGWGQYNKYYENTLYLDTDECYAVKGWNCATQVFRNVTEPEGLPCYGNRMLELNGYLYPGDVTEDGLLDGADADALLAYLLGKDVPYISADNADPDGNNRLTAADLSLLKQNLLHPDTAPKAGLLPVFRQEETGKWRMTNGLGGMTLTFAVSAEPGCNVRMGYGYWDAAQTNPETGASGLWIQKSLGAAEFDSSGMLTATVTVPENVTNIAFEIYDYLAEDNQTKLDKDSVTLTKVIAK